MMNHRLKLALEIISRTVKIKELKVSDFQTLGLGFDSYRKDQILDACVQIIYNEITKSD